MAKVDKSFEEQIDAAIAAGKISYAETDIVDDYDGIAADVLQSIFKLNSDETFISDESILRDFAGCCVSEDSSVQAESLSQFYDRGSKIMINLFREIYGVDVNEDDLIVDVFEQIRQIQIKVRN